MRLPWRKPRHPSIEEQIKASFGGQYSLEGYRLVSLDYSLSLDPFNPAMHADIRMVKYVD